MAFDPANPFDFMFSGGNRSYNKVGDSKQTTFGQVFNPYYVNGGISGQWQPATTNNQGALRVDIGTGVSIAATFTGGNVTVVNSAPIPVTGTVTAATWSKTKTVGYVATFSASAVPCVVNKVQGFTKTTVQPSYLQLHDSAATPSAGATPDFVVAVQSNNNFFADLAEAGVTFTNGLQVVNSSTADIYTAIGASDFICSVVYK
jgi:hypothetical protein